VRVRLGLCATAAALVACAEVAPPPGGPADRKPPLLLAVEPESLATQVDRRAELRFTFSEAIDRASFTRALSTAPFVELERARFDGLVVEVRPREDWPDSTTIVWLLDISLKDKHGVPASAERGAAFTRQAELAQGRIGGRAKQPPSKLKPAKIFAELTQAAPDGRRRIRWRRAMAGADGSFSLEYLRPGDGPYLLEVFEDRNGNGRRDEREATARVDSLFLPDSLLTLAVGELTLLDLEGPVELRVCATLPADSSRVMLFGVDESDLSSIGAADSNGCARLSLVPGPARVGSFLDLDADGRFGPDSTGISEPYGELVRLVLAPARPESLQLAAPSIRSPWATIDSLPLAPPPAVRSSQQP
jgi:hypothetical protein